MILSSDVGAETRAANGYVILFGMITATAITVLYVPIGYAIIVKGSG